MNDSWYKFSWWHSLNGLQKVWSREIHIESSGCNKSFHKVRISSLDLHINEWSSEPNSYHIKKVITQSPLHLNKKVQDFSHVLPYSSKVLLVHPGCFLSKMNILLFKWQEPDSWASYRNHLAVRHVFRLRKGTRRTSTTTTRRTTTVHRNTQMETTYERLQDGSKGTETKTKTVQDIRRLLFRSVRHVTEGRLGQVPPTLPALVLKFRLP